MPKTWLRWSVLAIWVLVLAILGFSNMQLSNPAGAFLIILAVSSFVVIGFLALR